MHTTARRIGSGQALKEAMRAYGGGQGITLKELARRTVLLDPAGKGVSLSLIGFLTAPPTAGVSGSGPNRARRYRDTTSTATADLLEQALDARPGQLFTREQVRDPGDPEPEAVMPVATVRAAG